MNPNLPVVGPDGIDPDEVIVVTERLRDEERLLQDTAERERDDARAELAGRGRMTGRQDREPPATGFHATEFKVELEDEDEMP